MATIFRKGWPFLGYGFAVLMFLAWQGAREDLAASKAECNTRVAQGALDAQEAVNQAILAASEAFQARERVLVGLAEKSLETADLARNNVKTNIKEVIREIPANNCASHPVLPALRGLYAD